MLQIPNQVWNDVNIKKMKIIVTITILTVLFQTGTSQTYPYVTEENILNNKAKSILTSNITQKGITYPFSFIVMGDSRIGNRPHPTYNKLSIDWVEIMEQIEATSFPNGLEFIINVGDLVNDGVFNEYVQYYDYSFAFMNRTSIPYISVPGNHEFYAPKHDYSPRNLDSLGHEVYAYNLFQQIVGNYNDYFDILDWRFVYLNNTQHTTGYVFPAYDQYSITNSQLNWFTSIYEQEQGGQEKYRSNPENLISFAHVPFTRIWKNTFPTIDYLNYKAYFDTLVAHNCRVHFAGHFHDYTRKYKCSEEFFDITTGGAGAELYNDSKLDEPTHNHNYGYHNYWHYLYVTVYADKRIKVEMCFKDTIRANGKVTVIPDSTERKFDFEIGSPSDLDVLHLENITVEPGEAESYFAENLVTAAGNGTTFTAKMQSHVEIKSNCKVVLLPGFVAEEGSGFSAYIVPTIKCDSVFTLPAKEKEAIPNLTQPLEKQVNGESIIFTRKEPAQLQTCIYPNPSKGIFTLNFHGIKPNFEFIKIYDSNKKCIKEIPKPNTAGRVFTVDLSNQANGVYYVVFFYPNGSQDFEKVIIQK